MKAQRVIRPVFAALILFLVLVYGISWGQDTNTKPTKKKGVAEKIDSRADSLLKAMSTYMATVNQYSCSTQRTVEVVMHSGQKIQFTNRGTVSLRRPNMIRVDFTGDPMNPEWVVANDKRRPMDVSLYYNGDTLTVYEKLRDEYASAAVPSTIDSMIDYAWNCLDIEAPAADLLFQDSYSGLMDGVTAGTYLGIADIDSTQCHHLAFRKAEVDWQIWIENSRTPLPRKFMITSKKETGSPDFDVRLSQWNLSPNLPDNIFAFIPPSNAKKTEYKSKKCKEKSK